MVQIMLLEIITIVSFVFSMLLIFISFASSYEMLLVFAWTIAVTMIFVLGSRKSRLFEISITLLLLPLIYFYDDIMSVFFVAMTAILIYLYAKKSLLKGSHDDYANNLKKAFFLYIVAVAVRSLFEGMVGNIGYAAPFIVIYLLASVVLTRSIRHIDSGMDPKILKRANVNYLVLMSMVAALVTLDDLRSFFISLILGFYGMLGHVIMTATNAMGALSEMLFRPGDGNNGSGLDEAVGTLPNPGSEEQVGAIIEENVQFTDLSIFERVITVLLVLAVGYIVYRLFFMAGARTIGTIEYTEDREYIRKDKDRKKLVKWDRYPTGLQEQIRYYYRKYLVKLKKSQVMILKSDTSQDVNKKAEPIFDVGIDKIRKIYIDSRYGAKEVNIDTVKEIEILYKEL